jgi:hypothetical protein
MSSQSKAGYIEYTYHKVEIDNALCKRRFHVAFEEGQKKVAKTQVTCPHCDVVVWEAENHVPGVLLREENLVKSPDGTNPMVYECHFKVN